LGPEHQDAAGSQLSKAASGPKGQESSDPKPMEVDAPDPPSRVRSISEVRNVQRLIYYISEVLHDGKTRYLEVHKLLYVVLIVLRKMRHYF
jgi:hypothetical protein